MKRIYKWNGMRWAEVVPVVWIPVHEDLRDPNLSWAIDFIHDRPTRDLAIDARNPLSMLGVPADQPGCVATDGWMYSSRDYTRRHRLWTESSGYVHVSIQPCDSLSALVSENGLSPAGVIDSANVNHEEWVKATDALLREVKDSE